MTKSELAIKKLNQIEAEMKKIGFWYNPLPDLTDKNFLSAQTFEMWLQGIFLPNARKAAVENNFPEKSEVGQMAFRQYDYHETVVIALDLLQLLREFDDIINKK